MTQGVQERESVHGRMLAAQLGHLRRQMEQIGAEQERLRNTLVEIASESDVSLGCVCCQCDEAYLVIKDTVMSCPSCAYRSAI